MSSIQLLPLYRVVAGVQPDEDWSLAFMLTLADGVTPIDLSGISFIANIWISATTSLAVVGQSSGDILTFSAPATAKASWPGGAYPLTILATDNLGASRDLLGYSTLTIGAPQTVTVSQILAPGGQVSSLLSSIPPALTPQAIMAGLPDVQNGDAIPAPGQAFFNADGYLVKSQ